MTNTYLYIQSVHIVFVVSWFSGLFYMPRLFIYHTEAADRPEPAAFILTEQFKIMERRLWQIIMVPAMILTLASGITLVWLFPYWLQMPWLQVKLVFVGGVILYHGYTWKLYRQLQQGIYKRSSGYLRVWNEVATLLLVAIVFIVVLKNAMSWIWGVGGLLILGVLLGLGIRLYKRLRNFNKG